MSNFPSALRYQNEATRLREQAAHASDHEIRKDLEKIALQYELLAESIERGAWGRSRRHAG